jgi:hypothetical protein
MKLDYPVNGGPARRIPKTDENGKPVIVSGKDYEDQINDLEHKINTWGYSLHDRRTAPIIMQRSKLNNEKFRMQKNQLRTISPVMSKTLAKNAIMSRIQKHDYSLISQMYEARLKSSASGFLYDPKKNMTSYVNQALASKFPQQKLKEEFKSEVLHGQWGYPLGDSKFLAASINADTDLAIKKEKATFSANANATVTIFSQKVPPIVDISASAQAPPKDSPEEMKLDFHVQVLTDELFQPIHKHGKDPIKEEGDLTQDFPSPSYEMMFPIGPIPVKVKLEFTATVGAKYILCVSPLYIDAKITPFIDTHVIADAEVYLVVASAGAKFDMTLFKDQLEFGSSIALKTDKQDPYVEMLYYGHQNLTALAGKFTAYVAVDLLLWSDEWDWIIFTEPGFTHSDYLFAGGEEINLRTLEVTPIDMKKNVFVKIRQLAVNRSNDEFKFRCAKKEIKNKGYFVMANIFAWGPPHGDRSSRVYSTYHSGKYPPGTDEIRPADWSLENKEALPNSKASVHLEACVPGPASSADKQDHRNVSCMPLKVSQNDPKDHFANDFVYDFVTHTFSGNKASGKAGEYVTLRGPMGEIEFTIDEQR